VARVRGNDCFGIRQETSNVKKSNKTVLGCLTHLRAIPRKDLTQKCAVCEPSLRSEVFSGSDRIEQHGKTSASYTG
jgi:hypothetical protein